MKRGDIVVHKANKQLRMTIKSYVYDDAGDVTCSYFNEVKGQFEEFIFHIDEIETTYA